MDSLEEQNSCIVLNNQSAECIVNGEYDKGINALLKVLALMRNSIARQNQSPTEAHSYGRCNDYTSARVPEFWYGSQCSSVASFPSSTTTASSSHINGGGYVFQHPILIRNYVTVVNRATSTVNAIAIMYNLALALHLKGTACTGTAAAAGDHPNNKHLERATALYRLCYNMLVMHHNQCDNGKTITIDFDPCFLMAISNNLGMICTVCGMKDKANTFFQHLLSTQMYCYIVALDESQSSTTFSSSARDEIEGNSSAGNNRSRDIGTHLDGFWSNTLELVLGSSSAPAA